jgi:hypothetical protein
MQVWYVRTPEILLPLARRIVIRTRTLPLGRPRSRTGARRRLPRTTLTFLPFTRTVAEIAFLPFGIRSRMRNERRDVQDFCCTPATPPAAGGVGCGPAGVGSGSGSGSTTGAGLNSSAPMSTLAPMMRASVA